MAADADKFQAARAASALCNEPVYAASENLRDVDKSLHVVDDGGLLPEANLAREGRLVARFGAMALNSFDERAFFAADVSAGTDKNFELVVEVAAQDFLPEKPGPIAAANFFAENFFLKMVLVANVKDAALGSCYKAGDDHALDEQMRQIGHDKAVLDGAGLAFISVADNIFDGIGLFAHEIPLHAGGKSGPAHAFQFGRFKLGEDVIPCFGLNELAHDAILFAVSVGIGFAGDALLFGMRLVNVVAANGAAADLLGKNVIVDGNSRSVVAPAKAGDVANLHIFRA